MKQKGKDFVVMVVKILRNKVSISVSKWTTDAKERPWSQKKKPHFCLPCSSPHLTLALQCPHTRPCHSNMFTSLPGRGTLTYLDLWHFNQCFLTFCSPDTHWLWGKLLMTTLMERKTSSKESSFSPYKMVFLSKPHSAVKQSPFFGSISTCRSSFHSLYTLTNKLIE